MTNITFKIVIFFISFVFLFSPTVISGRTYVYFVNGGKIEEKALAAQLKNFLRKQKEIPHKIKITGKVTDALGEVLIGANVMEKETGRGTITDIEGRFALEVSPEAELSVSYIGYLTFRVKVREKRFFNIVLKEEARELKDVIITALGIEKKESSLSYSAIQIKGEELLRSKEPNMIAALAGKAAGVQINKVSSGMGGSSKVLIRGIRTVASDNQPLYVIDGVPIQNTSNEQAYTAIGGTADAGNRDGGDGISNLNPEDVESISILKGAPAAALYGSQAANGVILITTKTGNIDKHKITFSTNLTFDRAFCLPEFQNTYSVSDGIESWGEKAKIPSYDNPKEFFNTGVTSITSVSVSSGNKNIRNYFSYANTTGKGIVGKNKLSRNNIMYRGTTSLFNNKLKIDGNVTLMRQTVKNRPASGGFYMNPLVGLYRFPRGNDISIYKNQFEIYDDTRQLYVQNWHSDTQDFEQNPYWVINRIQSKDVRTRMIASLSTDLKIKEWFKIQGRISFDYSDDKLRQKFYASTAPALAGKNGRYIEYSFNETLFYGDIMALFDKRFSDFSLHAAIGFSITDKNINSIRYDSKTASLRYANIFNLANINMNSSAYIDQQIEEQRQLQAVFATMQIGYKESLYLDFTARNDWSSTLAYTSHEKKGYFYPSVGVAWLLGKTFKLPEFISFGKIRIAGSRVGNDLPPQITYPLSKQGAGGVVQAPKAKASPDLGPEMTSAIEFGTEWRLFNHRFGINVTYYNTHTRNQFFQLPAPSGEKAAYIYVNAGDIRNRGVEAKLDATPVLRPNILWKTEFNFSANRNKVLRLHDELPEFIYGPRGFSSSYAMKLRKGGSFGDIYGKAFKRDEKGAILYESEGKKKGLPQFEGEGNTIKVGNANPKFNLSWNNIVSYKGFEIAFLIDGRFGGKILSQTQADLDMFGVTEATAKARDCGYVILEGHKIEDVKGFYKLVGGRAGVTEYYMYDATNIRLREFSVSYVLPQKWTGKNEFLKTIRLSVIARNLFFIYKKAPFDPDLVLSTRNDNQGIEIYGMPITRSIGFNIKCEF